LPELVCNTSPLQYLHQIGLLHLLRDLGGRVWVPSAVVRELEEGRARSIDLPSLVDKEWICVRSPASAPALPLVTDLGPGEAEVLALALEAPGIVAVLDDSLARRMAEALSISFTGTLGLLLDAKRAGLVPEIKPLVAQLDALGFRLAPQTRVVVLQRAGEAP